VTRLRQWSRFSIRSFFVALTLLGVWLGVQLIWKRDREESLHWVTQQGRYVQLPYTQPPLGLFLFGERGVTVMDVGYEGVPPNEFSARIARLRELFPEAEIRECRRWGGRKGGEIYDIDPDAPRNASRTRRRPDE